MAGAFAGAAHHDENVGRHPGIVIVHPVIDEQVARHIDVVAVAELVAQGGQGIGNGNELDIIICHRHIIRAGIDDAEVVGHCHGLGVAQGRGSAAKGHKPGPPGGGWGD